MFDFMKYHMDRGFPSQTNRFNNSILILFALRPLTCDIYVTRPLLRYLEFRINCPFLLYATNKFKNIFVLHDMLKNDR